MRRVHRKIDRVRSGGRIVPKGQGVIRVQHCRHFIDVRKDAGDVGRGREGADE